MIEVVFGIERREVDERVGASRIAMA